MPVAENPANTEGLPNDLFKRGLQIRNAIRFFYGVTAGLFSP